MATIQMTRQEYEQKYGMKPGDVSKIDLEPSKPMMTRAEYKAKYGVEVGQPMPVTGIVPGAESAAIPATPLQTTNPLQATKVAPNILKDAWELVKGMTYGTAKNIASIPSETLALIKESGGIGGAVKNIGKALPGATAEVAWGLVPQSTKELANTQAISDIPKEFQALVKESGGYANALKNIAKSMPGAIPEAVKEYVNQIDRAGQAFINHPLFEALGYMGMKTIAENPKLAIAEIQKGLKTTGEFLTSPVKSLTDVGKEVGGKVSEIKTGLKQKADAKTIAEREKAIYDIEKNYAKTRKAIDYSKDEGASSRKRIAETDVLVNSVDADGTLNTKRPGGAIDQYKELTIKGVEDTVLKNLEREGTKINIVEVVKELYKQISESRLPLEEKAAALKTGILKQTEGLKLKADVFGDIPLSEIQKDKINTNAHINYQTPAETATYRKAVARAEKNVIEKNAVSIDANKVNGELAKYLKDIELLENLDGRKVKGGKLGKYFAQITGNIVGGAAGAAIGGIPGAAVGTVVGGEVAGAIKGKSMAGTFGKEAGFETAKNPILEEARRISNLPKERDLTKPDPKVGASKNIPKTKEIYRLEREIQDNVEAQKRAIKAKDFKLVAKLKELYDFLVETLKKLIKDERGFINPKAIAEDLGLSKKPDLLSEAKKYKSAEEFVKAQQIPLNFKKLSEVAEDMQAGMIGRKGTLGDFISNPEMKTFFGDVLDTEVRIVDDLPSNVSAAFRQRDGEAYIVLNQGITASKDIYNSILEEALHAKRYAKKRDFTKASAKDNAKHNLLPEEMSAEKGLKYLKNNFIKTKSQLTDIWNQANKTPDILSEAKSSLGQKILQTGEQKPTIKLKRDVTVTTLSGEKVTIPEDEVLKAYESGGKALLKDGREYIVSKSQYENIKNNSLKSEAKEFAPELKGTEDVIKGEGKLTANNIVDTSEHIDNLGGKHWKITYDTGQGFIAPEGTTRAEAIRMASETTMKGKGISTKFSQYQLPNGKNYREILIKAKPEITGLPKELHSTFADIEKFKSADEFISAKFKKGLADSWCINI